MSNKKNSEAPSPPCLHVRNPQRTWAIGDGQPCFIVAELSANHGQDLKKAEEIIRAAAAAGADAIKLQTYLPTTMTIDCDRESFVVKNQTGPHQWKSQKLFSLYEKAFTPWEWHAPLKKLCEDLGMLFFSTPFDSTAVDFLETLGVTLYKVASYEVTDLPLLKKIAQTRKPVIISTGFASLEEIAEAVAVLRAHGTTELAVLHCVTNYSKEPSPEHTHLANMADLRTRLGVVVGFSDNTGGIEIPLQAVHMGAAIIEKHVVAQSGDAGLDADFSLNSDELKSFVNQARAFEKIRGTPQYGALSENEKYFQNFRRSVFVVEDVAAGEVFSDKNIRVIRPAYGLAPKHYESLLGKRAKVKLERGTPLKWEYIE